MQISVNDDKIVFTDDKNKSLSLELFEQMADAQAVKAINRELTAQGSASKAAVSLMTNILNHPSMDGYKGTTEWTSRISPELKQAMRRAEDEYITPLFFAQHGNPSAHAGTHENMLTPDQRTERKKYAHVSEMLNKYLTDLRAGGSYAVARGFVLEYFAKAGERPIAENGKLLSVAALKKILELKRKENATTVEDEGFSGKLIKLSAELSKRTDKTNLGSTASAVAALRAMLVVFEGIEQQNAELVTKNMGGVAASAQAVTDKAKEPAPQGEAEPASL